MTQGIARRSLVLGGALAPAAWLALPGVAHAGGQIEEPLMREIRYLDKLVDELAKGRPMEKILRA